MPGAPWPPPPQTQPGLNGVEMSKPDEAPQGMKNPHTNQSARKQQGDEKENAQINPSAQVPPGMHGPYPSFPQVPQGRQGQYTPHFPQVPQDPNTLPFPQVSPGMQVPYPFYPPVPHGRQEYTPYFPQVPPGMQNPDALPFPQLPAEIQGSNKLPFPQVPPGMEGPHMPPQIPPGIQVPHEIPQIPPRNGPYKPPFAPPHQVPDVPTNPLPYYPRGIDDVYKVAFDETKRRMEGTSPQNHLRQDFAKSGNVPVVFNFFTPIKVVNKDGTDRDVPKVNNTII
ncbi:unnamed protein product [Cylicocyclus nassatus]|uniref:Uncharacterized protein n=1 Tax=Cylicocyclus nassatus TaxID=53992 RepID=A0AA36MGM5_CYLNA|nr:unnamed protein product [Cylicocyclus nassatus]